ncbi:hypothetical protein MNBD_IGNAVI01-1721, partial [hydrothermal vent metagenome]
KIAHIKLEAGDLEISNSIYITGNTTGLVETTLQAMVQNNKQINSAAKGEEVTFYLDELVRPRDQVYKIVQAD